MCTRLFPGARVTVHNVASRMNSGLGHRRTDRKCVRCTQHDTVSQRNQAEAEAHQRAADAVAPAASGRLAGAGRVRRLHVRRPVARPRARRLPGCAIRAGQPVLLARGFARRRAAHRPRGPAAPGAARRRPAEDRAGAGQEQARARHRERQMSPVQHLHVRAPDQALRLVQ